jgi:hypothetical protein
MASSMPNLEIIGWFDFESYDNYLIIINFIVSIEHIQYVRFTLNPVKL